MFERLLRLFRPRAGTRDDVTCHRQAVLATGGEATHTVVVRIDPAAMENADLEVRWELERTLRALHPEIAFYDDGYGFARNSDAMFLSYATREPDRLVDAIVDLVTNDKVQGYEMAAAVMIALAAREPMSAPGQEFVNHRLLYPPAEAGKPLPD